MNKMPIRNKIWYPDDDVIVFIHEKMIALYGGHKGFERGTKSIEMIIDNVMKQRTIYKKASVLLKNLFNTRIFSDGNHRTAYEVTDLFLRMNGKKRVIDDKNKIQFMKKIRYYDIVDIERWLKYGKTKNS
jgi:prophage maintenance system killer protein